MWCIDFRWALTGSPGFLGLCSASKWSGMSRKFVVHAAKIPESAQELSPVQRRERGVWYVNACDGKKWNHAPDGSLEEPWTVEACESCKVIVSYQPPPGRSAPRASLRSRHSQ